MSRSQPKTNIHKHPPAETKSEEAMHALMMTAKLIMHFGKSRISKHKHFHKLSGPRIGVLFVLAERDSVRMSELAQKLHVAPRTVTDLVDGLERDGFVIRVPDPKDRRASILELTPSTKADMEKINAMRKAFSKELFSVLSTAEQNQLIEILAKLREGPLSEFMKGKLE